MMHIWDGKDTLCGQVRTGRLDMDNYREEEEPEENVRLCFGCQRRQRQQREQEQHDKRPETDAYRALLEARRAEREAFDRYVAETAS